MKLAVQQSGEGQSVWVVGDLYTTLASGEDTGGAYALLHALVPPGGGPPPHRHHREDEAFYILEVEITCHADGRSYTARAGSWVSLPKGSLHSFKNVGTAPARMLILVNPSGLEKYFAEVGQKAVPGSAPPPVTPAEIERLQAVAPKYGLEIHAGPDGLG